MLKDIKNKLIVSCQALPNEPLHSSFIMGRMAMAAKMGGAAAIRAQGVEDINEIINVFLMRLHVLRGTLMRMAKKSVNI